MNPRRVIEEVAQQHRVSMREILGKSRLANIVLARREAMVRLYLQHRRNTPELADIFGCRTTSVRYHLREAGVRGRRKR